MFPVSSQQLALLDIADYWSREIKPQASKWELFKTLVGAWLRGELSIAAGPNRVEMLRLAYNARGPRGPVFVVPGQEDTRPVATPDKDGNFDIDLSPRIPLPNSSPESWSEENCARAFEVIADRWEERLFPLAAPVLAGMLVTFKEFTGWTRQCRYAKLKFWQHKETGPASRKRFNRQSAEEFTADYVKRTEAAGREPKQAELEAAAIKAGRSGRDLLREAYHDNREAVGKEVRPGPPQGNSPAK